MQRHIRAFPWPAVYLLFVSLVASTLPAAATTLESRTGADLVIEADAIVAGRCVDAESVWRGRALMTRYTIAVDDSLKGPSSSHLTLWVPGGIDRDRAIPISVTVPGAPLLMPGQEMLLFLDELQDPFGDFALVGLSQGVLSIERDPQGAGWLRATAGPARQKMSLESVKAEIRAFLAKEEGR